jgi:hypothetical protein
VCGVLVPGEAGEKLPGLFVCVPGEARKGKGMTEGKSTLPFSWSDYGRRWKSRVVPAAKASIWGGGLLSVVFKAIVLESQVSRLVTTTNTGQIAYS